MIKFYVYLKIFSLCRSNGNMSLTMSLTSKPLHEAADSDLVVFCIFFSAVLRFIYLFVVIISSALVTTAPFFCKKTKIKTVSAPLLVFTIPNIVFKY